MGKRNTADMQFVLIVNHEIFYYEHILMTFAFDKKK